RKGEVDVFRFVLRGVSASASATREASRREKIVTTIGAVDLVGVAGVSGEGGAEAWQPNLGDFSGEWRWIAVISGGYLHWFFSFSTVSETWDLLHRQRTLTEEAAVIKNCRGDSWLWELRSGVAHARG
ncbi:hypothetical protein U1Q18_042747, partial [Sarracenia purpurea var. burkii]